MKKKVVVLKIIGSHSDLDPKLSKYCIRFDPGDTPSKGLTQRIRVFHVFVIVLLCYYVYEKCVLGLSAGSNSKAVLFSRA